MPVRQLLESMDSQELSEWEALDRYIEPIGGQRSDYLAAKICAQMWNVRRGKDDPYRQPGDYMPRWEGPPDTQEAQDEDAKVAADVMRVMGALAARNPANKL